MIKSIFKYIFYGFGFLGILGLIINYIKNENTFVELLMGIIICGLIIYLGYLLETKQGKQPISRDVWIAKKTKEIMNIKNISISDAKKEAELEYIIEFEK